ncbi:LuxR C-terminal-related transcriptional regulator [Phocaeicola vulgatus]|uniref:LuxR C-terminal-related transcriptional regulator n=1 Tax=Phocaeicola vulgatus TaxID=821 RepID=UPI00155E48F5|nr:LuxR C-terminal-related transcriptional regulator [Phocaeicola vulgatus]NMW76412.1 LuxR family transcriptional regulator [Phocaeicola vulgatus]
MTTNRQILPNGLLFQQIIDNSIEEGSLMGYQQKKVFLLFLAIVYLCIPTYTFSLPFPDKLYYYLNATQFAALLSLTILYFTKQIKTNTAFSAILFLTHIEICIEMIYCSINDDYAFQRLLIMSNMVISVLYIMISICAYMYKISIQLSFISVVSYIVCVIVTQGPFLTSFLPLIVIIYGMAAILGHLLNKNINSLLKEYNLLKAEEASLLKSLQMSRDELFAFAQLVGNDNSKEKNGTLLSILGEKTKKNLYAAIASHIKEEKSHIDVLRTVFPELSPSELSICRLIVQDKTVSQISEILHRSSGNITSQRSNIRSKLKLEKNDNLKEVLLERMREYEEQHSCI